MEPSKSSVCGGLWKKKVGFGRGDSSEIWYRQERVVNKSYVKTTWERFVEENLCGPSQISCKSGM